jgi:hypothetical protein
MRAGERTDEEPPMPMPHTRTDPVAANPPMPSTPELKLTWQFDGERLTCRWNATPAEQLAVEIPLPDVA